MDSPHGPRVLSEPEAVAIVLRLRYSLIPETRERIEPLLAEMQISGSVPRALSRALADDSAANSLLSRISGRQRQPDTLLSAYVDNLMLAAQKAASKLLFDGMVSRIASFFEGTLDYGQLLRFLTLATRSGEELRFALGFLDRNILLRRKATVPRASTDESDYVTFLSGLIPSEEEDTREFHPEEFEDIIGGDDIDIENAIVVGTSYRDLLFFYETMQFAGTTPLIDFTVNRRYFNWGSTGIAAGPESKDFDGSFVLPLEKAMSDKLHEVDNAFEVIMSACVDCRCGKVTKCVKRVIRALYGDESVKIIARIEDSRVKDVVEARMTEAAVRLKVFSYHLLGVSFAKYGKALQRVVPYPFLGRPAIELVKQIAGGKMGDELKRQLVNIRRIIKKTTSAGVWGPKLSDRRNIALVSAFCVFYKEFLKIQDPPRGFTAPPFYVDAVTEWVSVFQSIMRAALAEVSEGEAKKINQNQRKKRTNLKALVDNIRATFDTPLLQRQPVFLTARMRDQETLEFIIEPSNSSLLVNP